ncbi:MULTISPECIES: transglycosylase SLT domain-containing protein [unclassified Roseovarius]|uniref:transglycosylase SLT domain-containing protein n=1 Tax=unclassified Roseovarius TaxID=2614913 RepID=UPI00273E9C82|nr:MULTISPECIES: transglycosylase SLT domain-containing protein [unclassified Roseovarius]
MRAQTSQNAGMKRVAALVLLAFWPGFALAVETGATEFAMSKPKPPERTGNLPRTRWENRPEAQLWTRAALSALKEHGARLPQTVPRDIEAWCPAYAGADEAQRRAFWVGLLSALAKHESTFRPRAVGGGGKWFGLVQISPGTARGYNCRARSGEALKKGAANLSCAIRIMAVTVPRDGVVSQGMRGVAADWGPFHNRKKRNDMMQWTRKQTYCKPMNAVRPRTRPIEVASATLE